MASRAFLSLLADEQDSSLRYSLYLTATLTTTTDRLPVTVCEIGSNGLRVEGSGLPRIGRDVIVSCGTREIFGCIVSADALAREIEFEDAIDEGEILLWLHLSAEQARATTEAFKRPPVARSVLTPDQQRTVEAWKSGESLPYRN